MTEPVSPTDALGVAGTLGAPGAHGIEMIDVQLGYGNVAVLSELNLSVAHGELVGILGRSGAGKSTLLAALAGASVQQQGTLLVNGIDPRRAKHPVGLVPQIDVGVLTRLSVSELVALGDPRRGLFTSRAERRHADGLLERLGLGGLGDRRLDQLSGGQRQRVAIARALNGSAQLLLCDEPTSGADPVLAAEIVDVLAELAASGTTVLVATHDMAVVAPRLGRLVGLAGGTIRFNAVPGTFDAAAHADIYHPEPAHRSVPTSSSGEFGR
jgi:ABC-type Mn2+/Zn2+ transport system ATPase subunit